MRNGSITYMKGLLRTGIMKGSSCRELWLSLSGGIVCVYPGPQGVTCRSHQQTSSNLTEWAVPQATEIAFPMLLPGSLRARRSQARVPPAIRISGDSWSLPAQSLAKVLCFEDCISLGD